MNNLIAGFADRNRALHVAQEIANVNECPVALLERDGVFAVCEEPPDDAEDAPLENGWSIVALIEPREVGR